MRRPHLFLLLAIGLISSVSRSAHASQITINYAASVTASGVAAIPVGNVVTGSFTYETAGFDVDPSPNNLQIADGFKFITAGTGAFSFAASAFQSSFADAANDFPGGDFLSFVGINGSVTNSNSPSLTMVGAVINLAHAGVPPIGPLTSAALPTELSLGDWPDQPSLLLFLIVDGTPREIRATFTSLGDDTASPNPAVPEPGTLSLLGLGLVALARSVRRRRV